jgi:Protein of unknown function (DUF2914)
MIRRLRKWVQVHISTIAFVLGFVGDTLTLKRIDLWYENTVFLVYLTCALVGILLMHGIDTKRWAAPWLARTRAWLPIMVQIPLGGLFSGFIIFYTKSASLTTSWPFVVLLITLFIGNEFLRKRYELLVFQLSIFYIALLTYLVLITPTVLGTIGIATFLLAGLLSLFCIVLIIRMVVQWFPDVYKRSARTLFFSIGGIYLGFNLLYFSNAIPPVPLAVKDIGMYHSVVRAGGGYQVVYEAPKEYEFWRNTSSVYHRTPREAAYCFSSVFAPTRLRAKIYHSWQRLDDAGDWVRESRIPFSIEGGRDGGYRGYTIKQNITSGEWKCVVETEEGHVVGETRFVVVDTTDPVGRVTGVR